MRRHHYKIDVLLLSVLNVQPRRIPLVHEARRRNILKFTFQERLDALFCLVQDRLKAL